MLKFFSKLLTLLAYILLTAIVLAAIFLVVDFIMWIRG